MLRTTTFRKRAGAALANVLNQPEGPGVHVDEKELQLMWETLNRDGDETMNARQVFKALKPYYPKLTLEEVNVLVGRRGIGLKGLKRLLMENELEDFDPVLEAYTHLDPHCTGFVEVPRLKAMIHAAGISAMNEEDEQFIIDMADFDKDGKISLSDFREFSKQILANQSSHINTDDD